MSGTLPAMSDFAENPPASFFAFCPRCGAAAASGKTTGPFSCASCDFRLYFNVGCALVGFIVDTNGRLLLIRRAKEPQKGKWACPGGFADVGESAEEGLRREIQEEVGLSVGEMEYLCSYPNPYVYRGITYPVLDFFYICRLTEPTAPITLQDAEVTGYEWRNPETINESDIAFPSMRHALKLYLQKMA